MATTKAKGTNHVKNTFGTREKLLRLRLLDVEHEEWLEAALADRVTLSEFVRAAVREAVRVRQERSR